MTAEVLIYSKPGCHLCDTVKRQLSRLARRHAFSVREVNILNDREAFAQFRLEIPVVFINGEKVFSFHLDEAEFLERLARLERMPHGPKA
jgi:glutaredoxin